MRRREIHFFFASSTLGKLHKCHTGNRKWQTHAHTQRYRDSDEERAKERAMRTKVICKHSSGMNRIEVRSNARREMRCWCLCKRKWCLHEWYTHTNTRHPPSEWRWLSGGDCTTLPLSLLRHCSACVKMGRNQVVMSGRDTFTEGMQDNELFFINLTQVIQLLPSSLIERIIRFDNIIQRYLMVCSSVACRMLIFLQSS